MVCSNLLFVLFVCLCVLLAYWDFVSVCCQPFLCALPSLNNTNENTKTHILTSAVSWSRGALYWLHSCAVQSSLEALECELKLLMRPSSIPLSFQTQKKKTAPQKAISVRLFLDYVKNSSVRVSVCSLTSLNIVFTSTTACCQHFALTNVPNNDVERCLNTPGCFAGFR